MIRFLISPENTPLGPPVNGGKCAPLPVDGEGLGVGLSCFVVPQHVLLLYPNLVTLKIPPSVPPSTGGSGLPSPLTGRGWGWGYPASWHLKRNEKLLRSIPERVGVVGWIGFRHHGGNGVGRRLHVGEPLQPVAQAGLQPAPIAINLVIGAE